MSLHRIFFAAIWDNSLMKLMRKAESGAMMFTKIFIPLLAAAMLQNITINGVDVGGLTREEAIDKLSVEIPVHLHEVVINIAGNQHNYAFQDFGAGYNFADAVNQAVEYSGDSGIFKKLALLLKGHDIKAEFSYDAEKVRQIAEEIAHDTNIAAVEPTYARENGQFIVSQGKAGREIDRATLAADIIALLDAKTGGTIIAQFSEVPPKYTTAHFEEATDLIGTFTTPFTPDPADRASNLAVASRYLNNYVILPGEIFSTCAAMKPRITANGYVAAGQITNGEPGMGIGGGICQISSTLYMAALYAEMPVHERRNHSLMVSYMAPSTDATIAEGHIDLKLENHTDHPMLIESILTGDRHTINIYSRETRPVGRNIAFEAVLIESKPLDGDKIMEDPMLPYGINEVV